MRIVPATLADVKILAALNKRLIKDEEHPNPMTLEQLSACMSDWTYSRTTKARSLDTSSRLQDIRAADGAINTKSALKTAVAFVCNSCF